MSAVTAAAGSARRTLAGRTTAGFLLPGRRSLRVVERDLLVARHNWIILLSGFFEPLFYLLSLGLGLGSLVGTVTLTDGQVVDYAAFVAPALLASSAMNGGVYETTYNFFARLKWDKTYDTMLATPIGAADVAAGELAWAVVRGAGYATAFLVIMVPLGLVSSWWALLVPPVAVLTVAGFGAVGLTCTSFMRSWVDFEWVQFVLLPMFLFSTTFSPLATYPTLLEWVVRITPLYQSVTVIRGLCTGSVAWTMLLNVAYLVVMGTVGFGIATRRIARLLLR
jgi:lipooligosaccharide transport system permease protein